MYGLVVNLHNSTLKTHLSETLQHIMLTLSRENGDYYGLSICGVALNCISVFCSREVECNDKIPYIACLKRSVL